MTRLADDETLRKFVQRARRIEAHSLVQDWDELLFHAEGSFSGTLDVSGKLTMVQRLPADEEIFESLASRLRPLTMSGESIHYKKVLSSLRTLIGEANLEAETALDLDRIERSWSAAELQGSDVRGYAVQQVKIDGSEGTNMVSDTQLAAAWLYADLVHADANGKKAEALAFSMRERYSAAVRLFSHLAALTVSTLRLIENLQDAKLIDLGDDPWDVEVTVGTSELVQEMQAFSAPTDTPMPDLRESLNLGEEWKALTITDLLRQDPTKQVRFILRDGTGEILSSYDAAVTHRSMGSEEAKWYVLVAESVLFKFAFTRDEDQLGGGRVEGMEFFDPTNHLKLASTRLLLELHAASTVTAEVHEREFFTFEPPELRDDDAMRSLQVFAETLEDLLAVEVLSGQEIGPCDGTYRDSERVRLREVRLLWQGHIIRGGPGPSKAVSSNGNPPGVLVTPAGSMTIGGAPVPIPHLFSRHPQMEAVQIEAGESGNKDGTSYRVSIPEGTRFFVWAPTQTTVSGDNDLKVTAEVNLIGIEGENGEGPHADC